MLHCGFVAPTEQARPEVRTERLARVIEREVAPIWHDRFARLLLRHVTPRDDMVAIDVHCAAGRTTAELLRRLPDSSRVLALGSEPAELTLARARIDPAWQRRVYFKDGNFDDVLEIPDNSYDLAVANLVLTEQVLDWEAGLGELVRITKPGGTVLASVPLAGTWSEAEDLLDETLRDLEQSQTAHTLDRFRRRRPSATELAKAIEALEIGRDDYVIEHERFSLLFRSGREFLFSPVVEHGPLALWKAIIGDADAARQAFWRLKEAIDTYYERRVFSVSVAAAAIVIGVRARADQSTNVTQRYWRRYPSLDRVFTGEIAISSTSTSPPDDDALEFDITFDDDDQRLAAPPLKPASPPASSEFEPTSPSPSPAAPATTPDPRPTERDVDPEIDEDDDPLDHLRTVFEPPPVDDDDFEEVFEGAFDLHPAAKREPPPKRRTLPPAPPPKGSVRATRPPSGPTGRAANPASTDRSATSGSAFARPSTRAGKPSEGGSFATRLPSPGSNEVSSSGSFPRTPFAPPTAPAGSSGTFVRPDAAAGSGSFPRRLPGGSDTANASRGESTATAPTQSTLEATSKSALAGTPDEAPKSSDAGTNPISSSINPAESGARPKAANDGTSAVDVTTSPEDAQRRYASVKATQMLQAVPQPTRKRAPRRGRWGRQRDKG